jgi:hypothetical protein
MTGADLGGLDFTPRRPVIDKIRALGFEKLADTYIEYLKKNWRDLPFCIGHGLDNPQSHEVLLKLYKEMETQELVAVMQGAIDSGNMKSFSFLLKKMDANLYKDEDLLFLSLSSQRHEMGALLMAEGVNIDIFRVEKYNRSIAPLVSCIPEDKRKGYSCLFDLCLEHHEGFEFSTRGLSAEEIPDNIIQLAKKIGNPDISLSLIKKGFGYDSFLLGYNEDRLPELQSKYLEYLTDSKLKVPASIIEAPNLSI